MSKYPFIESYSKIKVFFEALQESETPSKFTYRYFARIGFPSSKDRGFVEALKKLSIVDEKSRPTEDYHNLKDLRQFKGTIRKGVERAYRELLDLDGNALSVSEDVLNGYFGRLTGESLNKAVVYTRTFKELVRLAGWEEKEDVEVVEEEQIVEAKRVDSKINLSINLPSTTDEKVYETLFKHLKDLITP